MKTKLVRPVLVESKEKTNIMLGDNITRNIPGAMRGTYYQLILISLENEKIEVGDKYYDKHNQLILSATTQSDHNIYNYKKVIATQPQLSPEYIQQAISEFNDGGMKDVEIETEKRFLGYEDISGLPMFDDIVIPKLTNGYVTIVNTMKTEEKLQQAAVLYKQNKIKSELDDHFDAFMAGAKSPESLEYWKEKEKLYSEEEVKTICARLLDDFTNPKYLKIVVSDFPHWFNQHKK